MVRSTAGVASPTISAAGKPSLQTQESTIHIPLRYPKICIARPVHASQPGSAPNPYEPVCTPLCSGNMHMIKFSNPA